MQEDNESCAESIKKKHTANKYGMPLKTAI